MKLVSWLDCCLDGYCSDGVFKGILYVNQGCCSSGSHSRHIPLKIYTYSIIFLDDGGVDYTNPTLRRQIAREETIRSTFIMPYEKRHSMFGFFVYQDR